VLVHRAVPEALALLAVDNPSSRGRESDQFGLIKISRRKRPRQSRAGAFRRRGYSDTSVEEIVRETGVAKGTFYYYFRTKEAVLEALATQLVNAMAELCRTIAGNPKLGPIDKFQAIFAELSLLANDHVGVMEDLHAPSNCELHDRSNLEIVRVLGPIFAGIVEEGRESGVFDVLSMPSTRQIIAKINRRSNPRATVATFLPPTGRTIVFDCGRLPEVCTPPEMSGMGSDPDFIIRWDCSIGFESLPVGIRDDGVIGYIVFGDHRLHDHPLSEKSLLIDIQDDFLPGD
jgi:AcrR family transcriptional regulator